MYLYIWYFQLGDVELLFLWHIEVCDLFSEARRSGSPVEAYPHKIHGSSIFSATKYLHLLDCCGICLIVVVFGWFFMVCDWFVWYLIDFAWSMWVDCYHTWILWGQWQHTNMWQIRADTLIAFDYELQGRIVPLSCSPENDLKEWFWDKMQISWQELWEFHRTFVFWSLVGFVQSELL